MKPERSLPRAGNGSPRFPETAVAGFMDELEKEGLELHSFMLVRRGCVVAEHWWAPYAPELPHMLFSLSKSFTSAAVGLAAAEGRLSLQDKVVTFFPDWHRLILRIISRR
ncbi:beta-lactamase family protein [Paenibacillus sp. CC-CFT747]|nr:beta-lactamase family protein [Paenibacillus sp. CC-CFT747]